MAVYSQSVVVITSLWLYATNILEIVLFPIKVEFTVYLGTSIAWHKFHLIGMDIAYFYRYKLPPL